MENEVNIIEYFRIIKSKWKLLVGIFVVAEITTLIVTIKMPRLYESTATILPPEVLTEKGSFITSRLPYIFREELPFSLYGGGPASQVIIAMLSSRRMARDVRREFGLNNFSKTKLLPSHNLQKATNISLTREGIISVTVKTKNPEFSSSIANFYVSNLDKMNDALKITSLKPIVTLLDSATPANQPCSPRVKLSLLLSGVLSIFVGVLLSFFINYIENLSPKNV